MMKAFKVNGSFLMGRDWQKFTREVAGRNEREAREIVYSTLGSKHRIKRKKIRIEMIKELEVNEMTDMVTKYLMERGDNERKTSE